MRRLGAWLASLSCCVLHGGHQDLLQHDAGRLWVVCLKCGRVSGGVEVARS